MAHKQVTARDRLFHDLTSGYNASLSPDKTELTLGLSPQFFNYDKASGVITAKVWEYHSWSDNRLTWNPAEYEGVKSLRLPSKHVWIPDTKLYNSVAGVLERDTNALVVVNHDGLVLWIPMANYQVLGEVRGNGEVSGKIKFGSWAYNSIDVSLKLHKSEGFDVTFLDSASRYSLVSSSVKVETLHYEQEPYSGALFNFVIKPHA